MPRFIPRALRDQVQPKDRRVRRPPRATRPARPTRTPRPTAGPSDAEPTGAEPTGVGSTGTGPSGGTGPVEVRAAKRRPSPYPRRQQAPVALDAPTGQATDGQQDTAGPERTGPERTGSRAVRPPVKAPARPGGAGTDRKRSRKPRKASPTGRTGHRGRTATRRLDHARRLTRLHRAAVVLGVLVVLAAAGAVLLWRVSSGGDATARARDQAVSVAQAAAPAILSYDYRTFDASVARGEKYTGGKFAKQYATSTHDLKASAKKEKAVVRATVAASSVVSATPDKVVLLLYVDQYRQNVNIDGQKVDQNRVVMTMTHLGGTWKVTKVTAI